MHKVVMVKVVYLTTVCILHDKAQTIMCLEGVFQSLQTRGKKKSNFVSCQVKHEISEYVL